MQPKKILVISLTRKGGGFEQYMNAILEHFTLPFTIYQSAFVSDEVKRKDARFILTYKGKVSFVFSSIFIAPLIFLYFCFKAGAYNALFVPHFHFFNLAFILAFRLRRKPVILVEHDGVVHFGDELPLQQMLINLCLKNATHIIFLSRFVRSQVSPHLLENKPTFIIPHGIFAFDGLNRKEKAYQHKPTLLFFGRVSKYKGIELLLEAMEGIPADLFDRLIIAGKSSYEYSLERLSSEILGKVEIIDRFLTQGEIASIFNRSHILIMPYIEASQSGVAAVAIANAMPCIVSNVGGLREQFILNAAGRGGQYDDSALSCAIIIKPIVSELREAIINLISDKALYTSLTAKTHLRQRELEWHNITHEIEEVIIKAIG